MAAYPGIARVAPNLVDRVVRAVEATDADSLGSADHDVRALVASLIAIPGANATHVLMELAELYRTLRAQCETQRAHLQELLGEQRRAHAGVAAYRSSGATSLKP